MSYIHAKASKPIQASEEELIVDLILFNKTAAQFIEQFNASEYIDFFGYSLDVCASSCEPPSGLSDYFKSVKVVPALFDRVLCELPKHAGAKIKKYAATQDAWKLFAMSYENTLSWSLSEETAHVQDLINAYIAASSEEYATFKSYFNAARALCSDAEATSIEIAHDAFIMYSASKVNNVNQIELPALEF